MKKVILATLVASIFSAPVLANPKIEFYGNMDAGMIGASNMGANKDTGTIFLNSPMRTSRLGFKGKEGIADGLTAGFQLEHQILPGDGSNGNSAGTSSTSNTLFNLAANLWIEDTTLGKLTLGRQNSVAFEAAMQGDTRKGMNFGSMMTYWNEHSMFGGTSTKATGQSTLNGGNQWSNAIRYTSPKWNNFTLAAQYGVGGVPGDLDANRKLAATVTYTGVKDLTLAVGQTLINDTTKEVGRTSIFTGNYKINDSFIVAAGFIKLENPSNTGGAFGEYDLKMLSTKYELTKEVALSGGWYQLSDKVSKENESTQYSLVADYTLSKNTGLYLGWARTENEGGMGVVPFGQGTLNLNSKSSTYSSAVVQNAGETHNAVVAGMIIRF